MAVRWRERPQRRAQSAPCLHRPSHSIVQSRIARSRRSALLRPRMRAAGGLDRPIREPRESNYQRPRVNLSTNARPRRYCRILFDGCSSQPPSHRPMWSTRIGGLRPRFVPLDSLPGRRLARRHVREANDRNGLRFDLRPKRQIRPDFRFDIVTLSTALACQSSMHGSRTQCCPHSQQNEHETGIDVQHGQAYHGRTTTRSARAAATTSPARSQEREQPDRRAL